ncbi:hypothetical protein Patl1_30748 [Pistacia atlantica]|uniref:Uncharacterized protein n=1 Tax=Pistacia atlantica TaxID=434234 RepID=A0ACC1A7H9_9ROSI|nr:hypothetical protein Patl1_30748 [Pistacia atlantica]
MTIWAKRRRSWKLGPDNVVQHHTQNTVFSGAPATRPPHLQSSIVQDNFNLHSPPLQLSAFSTPTFGLQHLGCSRRFKTTSVFNLHRWPLTWLFPEEPTGTVLVLESEEILASCLIQKDDVNCKETEYGRLASSHKKEIILKELNNLDVSTFDEESAPQFTSFWQAGEGKKLLSSSLSSLAYLQLSNFEFMYPKSVLV